MKFIQFVVLLGLAGVGYRYWHLNNPPAIVHTTGSSRFIPLPAPSGADPNVVQIIAAINCPKEATQRANDLAQQLSSQGIPIQRTDSVQFSLANATPSDAQRLESVMNGELPIVFVHGKGQANPSIAEVIAEYRQGG